MPWGKGHGKQQLVLEQLPHYHVPGSNDAIRSLHFDRLAIDFPLRGRKHQHTVDAHRKLQLTETTLAHLPERSVDVHVQRRAPLLVLRARYNVRDRTARRSQHGMQASELADREGAAQRRPGGREIEAIDDRLARHQAGDDTIEEKPRQNKVMPESRRLILASTSAYRRQLLGRLGLAFECVSPGVEETPVPSETPAGTAQRLATLKTHAVAARFPDALIIGADQVAALGPHRLDKPGNRANASAQLRALSGQVAEFHTAVTLLDAGSGQHWSRVVPCRVRFRELSPQQIETYLDREQPFDCAGSAKAEGLGIALIAAIETEDPTSLIGLPLIALTELLARAGMPALG